MEELSKETRDAIIDRLEGWELVDFLQIPIEAVIEVFENYILENIEDVEDFIGLREKSDDEDCQDER